MYEATGKKKWMDFSSYLFFDPIRRHRDNNIKKLKSGGLMDQRKEEEKESVTVT
jgi:hypothetical protein